MRLAGVITYADPDWRNAFFQDKGGAVYVDLNQANVRSGQFVELTGHTSSGGFAPEILGSRPSPFWATPIFPTPAKVDFEDFANGRLDAHWVQMEGVIRRADQQWGHLSLSLMTPQGRFKVIVPGFDNTPSPTNLIDALVSVTGACTSELNVRRQLSGITLHAPQSRLQDAKFSRQPSADPFSIIPPTPIRTRRRHLRSRPPRLQPPRQSAAAVVTPAHSRSGLPIVADASGGLRVLTAPGRRCPGRRHRGRAGIPGHRGFFAVPRRSFVSQNGHRRLARRQANVRRANSSARHQ